MLLIILLLSLLSYVFGAPKIDGRIIGGEDADIIDYPFQVSLRFSDRHHCGGSILNENTILTAAHCVSSVPDPKKYQVRAGSSSKSEGGQLIQVNGLNSHAKYNSSNYDNDIAIVKLESHLVFGPGVQPIVLPTEDLIINAGTKATVSGWGVTANEGESWTDILKAVTVPVVDQTVCFNALTQYINITERNLCAGEAGRDSCTGDSGGPLSLDGIIIGVVSWGNECGLDGYPGVYARVSEFISWIESLL